MNGELTYVTRYYNGRSLCWRIVHPYSDGAWCATITDAVPIGFVQPEILRKELEDLLRVLDTFELELL